MKNFLNRFFRKSNNEKGFTLIEVIVAIGLFIVLAGSVTATTITLSQTTVNFTDAATTQNQAADAISMMTRDISAASKIIVAEDYKITLETAEDGTSYEVSYFYTDPDDNAAEPSLPNGTSSADMPSYPAIMQYRKEKGAAGLGVTRVIAPGYSALQQNRTLFIYYDDANATMVTPMLAEADPQQAGEFKALNIARVDFGFALKVEDRTAPIELASAATPRFSDAGAGAATCAEGDTDCNLNLAAGCIAPIFADDIAHAYLAPRTRETIINWTAPADGTHVNTYTIYRKNDKQKANPMVVGVINVTSNATSSYSYTDDTVEWGERYQYYIVSGCDIGTSLPSDMVTRTVTPDQPTIVNINTKKNLTEIQANTSETGTTNASKGQTYTVARGLTNQVTWTKMNGALGYYLYRNGTQIARLGSATTTYQDYGRNYGDVYDYTVVAYNVGSVGSGGNSVTSAAANLISPPAKSIFEVAKPDTSILSTTTNNVINVTSRASNTTGYQVYRVTTAAAASDCANAGRTASLDFTGNSKDDNTIEWGTWTCYKILGYNDAGTGQVSDDIIAKQKPGKFGITSITGTMHRYADYSHPLPGDAHCWASINGNSNEMCFGGGYGSTASNHAPISLFDNLYTAKTNINVIWNKSYNAYADYSINQDRTQTGGIVDQGDDTLLYTAPYNAAGSQQSWAFGNQMPGSVYNYSVTAAALNGEARLASTTTYVSPPDVPYHVNIWRQSRAPHPQFRRAVGAETYTLRGMGDTTKAVVDMGGVSVFDWSNNGTYQSGTGNMFSAPATGSIAIMTTLTRSGQTRYSDNPGTDGLFVTGACSRPCGSDFQNAPETWPDYWGGASPRYYAGGYAAGSTGTVGDTTQTSDPALPEKPDNVIPDGTSAQCQTIYESDPDFTSLYGCKFGSGIPSPPSYLYLASMDGTNAQINWNAVPYTTGYTMSVTNSTDTTTYEYAANVVSGVVPLVDGDTSTISVTAKNIIATSVPSISTSHNMPGIPQNVHIVNSTDKVYDIAWNSTIDTTSYLITMMSAGMESTYTVTDTAATITVPTDNPGGTITVQAINANIGTANDTVATSTPSSPVALGAPEAPLNLRKTSTSGTTNNIAWDASPAATSYKITMVVTGTNPATTSYTTTGTTYALTVPYANNASITIQALANTDTSLASNPLTFESVIPAPSGLTLTSNNTLGVVSTNPSTIDWSAVSCAVGTPSYRLTRTVPNSTVVSDWQTTKTEYAPYIPLQATGGTVTDSVVGNITYRTHTFYNTGANTFNVTNLGLTGNKVKVLVVAGGGGGGMDMGGGGGAGGVIYTPAYNISTTGAINFTVGAGGAGSPAAGTNGQPSAHQYTISAKQGGNSTFGTVTATGGGYGASSYYGYTPNYGTPGTGGSGGGASGYSDGGTRAGGTGLAGQGFNGGNGGGQYYSGGGGGAGGAGANSPAQANGGAGIRYADISPYYFGGGGGGAAYSLGTGGNGGIGGGGGGAVGTTYGGGSAINSGANGGGGASNAWANTPGGNAGANTGGGGGGGGHYNSNNKGGDGGSGIVIVQYEIGNTTSGMHLPNTNYTYTVDAKCSQGAFTSPNATETHSFTPAGTAVAAPSVAPTITTPSTSIQATGGSIGSYTANGVTYRTHTFTGSGNFVVSSTGTSNAYIDYMVVAGGGGGGGVIGGGGGGGGVIESSTTVGASTYGITVGGGGAGGWAWNSGAQRGTPGGNSSAFGTTALGGGAGGAHGGADTRNAGTTGGTGGGCGGGGSGSQGTLGQGAAGGNYCDGNFGSGGGGAGLAGNGYTAGYFEGTGGQGHYTNITGSATYFGGGGGGGTRSGNGSGGNGGAGGGGHGGTTDLSKSAVDGTNGLGGGGGGGGHNGNGSGNVQSAGNGGSGTVVIRYPIAESTPYADTAHRINVTSTGQCANLHYGATPQYAFYRNGVKVGTTTSGSFESTTTGTVGDSVTYEYTVACIATLNGATYTTPESAKSPAFTVTLKARAPQAVGGIVNTYTSGSTTYRTHTFYGGGNFNMATLGTTGGNVDLLMVGGGGAGGAGTGGGGGAGGLIYINNYKATASNYGIGVGIGGVNDDVATGFSGQNTVMSNGSRTLTAFGGGMGASTETGGATYAGASGGSGGGGQNYYGSFSGYAATQPSTTSDGANSYAGTGFGSNGGNPSGSQSGGGGGAGGAGNTPGNGGAGRSYDITGSTSWYAAGGGSGYSGTTSMNGIGGRYMGPSGSSGAAWTGSGGSGGWDHAGGYGGHGGSGIVVIRYVVPQ